MQLQGLNTLVGTLREVVSFDPCDIVCVDFDKAEVELFQVLHLGKDYQVTNADDLRAYVGDSEAFQGLALANYCIDYLQWLCPVEIQG